MIMNKAYNGNAEKARESILEWIINSGIEPGHQLPPQSELVKILSCSATTVHNAMQGLVKQGVIRRKVGKGSFLKAVPNGNLSYPSELSRSGNRMVNNQSTGHRILVCSIIEEVPPPSHSPAHEVLSKAESELHNISILSNVVIKEFSRMADLENFIYNFSPEGGLFDWKSIEGEITPVGVDLMLGGKIPLVNCMHYCEPTFPLQNTVTIDDPGIGVMAMKHLADLGHKNILIAVSKDYLQFEQIRTRSALQVAESLGVSCEVVTPDVEGTHKEDDLWEWKVSGNFAYQKFKSAKIETRPTALFAVNDKIASSFVAAALADGVSIPDEISIVGVDNEIGLHFQTGINLTSVDPCRSSIGTIAARCLMDKIYDDKNGGGPSQTLRVAPKLIQRESTKSLLDG